MSLGTKLDIIIKELEAIEVLSIEEQAELDRAAIRARREAIEAAVAEALKQEQDAFLDRVWDYIKTNINRGRMPLFVVEDTAHQEWLRAVNEENTPWSKFLNKMTKEQLTVKIVDTPETFGISATPNI